MFKDDRHSVFRFFVSKRVSRDIKKVSASLNSCRISFFFGQTVEYFVEFHNSEYHQMMMFSDEWYHHMVILRYKSSVFVWFGEKGS